jgi:hypothetical protein
MSTISKVAVYDPRLLQEEPAYAVNKGALSVSVAPFQAISANSSQMTFQVLVPSLNVFVDRKIQLSTGLNFVAQLFYSGPRSASMWQVSSTAAGLPAPIAAAVGVTIADNILTFTAHSFLLTPQGTEVNQLPVGTMLYSSDITPAGASYAAAGANMLWGIQPGTMIVGPCGAPQGGYQLQYYVNIPQNYSGTPSQVVLVVPSNYDVADPSAGVSLANNNSWATGAFKGQAFLPAGFATAVSAKDLSLAPFPIQSTLSNMTATLNDCTVTTNGDTLREQLMLTSSHETLKQRTTPCKLDTFSWGQDDALNESGNFSSYSAVNGYGDIPNGAYPMTWYADETQSVPLASIQAIAGPVGKTAVFPFYPAGSASSFGTSTPRGCGWYIAAQASAVSNTSTNLVIVPFVNGQPVWTTGFPGGDLSQVNGLGPSNNTASPSAIYNPGFILSTATPFTQLTLTVDVPPYSMIGAVVYSIGKTPSGTQPAGLGFVSDLLSGTLGIAGSTYSVCTYNGAVLPALGAGSWGYGLRAGFPVTTGPMPVFGSVEAVEPLILSPLIWADSAEFQTVGLYGMTNMQFVLNFAVLGTVFAMQNTNTNVLDRSRSTFPFWYDDLQRQTNYTGNIIRSSGLRTVISDLRFGASQNQYGPWTNPTLSVGFLTPGPDVTLPLVSTVPYVEFPRYTRTVQTGSFQGKQTVSTNTISLTSIPDMVMLYIKPSTKGPCQLDQYIPIQNVSVTFDNFSNLCSGFRQFNLYESAVAAGLDMDWHQWRGFTQGSQPSVALTQTANLQRPAAYVTTGFTQLSGGPIILRFGTDITLSPGLAPGCLGNYSFQADVQTSNPYGYYDYLTAVQITIVAINTGFFETVRGQSAIRKTILNSADVEAASPEEGMSKTDLNRLVGRGCHSRGLSTMLGRGMRAASNSFRIGGRAGRAPMRPMLGNMAGKRAAPSSGL